MISDHKSMQTLQQELAERDEKLLNEISEVKTELQGVNKRLENLESGQDKMIGLLSMIAENTKRD